MQFFYHKILVSESFSGVKKKREQLNKGPGSPSLREGTEKATKVK